MRRTPKLDVRNTSPVRAEPVEALPFLLSGAGEKDSPSTGSGRTVWGSSSVLFWPGSQRHPLPDARIHVDHRVLRAPAVLGGDVLRPHVAALPVREHDGAD